MFCIQIAYMDIAEPVSAFRFGSRHDGATINYFAGFSNPCSSGGAIQIYVRWTV